MAVGGGRIAEAMPAEQLADGRGLGRRIEHEIDFRLGIGRLPTKGELERSLQELCRNAVDVDPILHAFKASQQLRIGVRDILGKQDVTQTTAALSDVAETILAVLVAREEARLVERLGEPMVGEGSNVGVRAAAVVLAMGKFGGREMNYHSDVDLVFLYDHDGMTFQARRRPSVSSPAAGLALSQACRCQVRPCCSKYWSVASNDIVAGPVSPSGRSRRSTR